MSNLLHRAVFFALIWASLSFFGDNVSAHLMPTGRGTINVVGSKAYIILSMPAASFSLKGTRGNGLLNAKELKENGDGIREQLRDSLFIASENSRATYKDILLNLPVSATEKGDDHDQNTNVDLTVMIVAELDKMPRSISIRSNLWPNDREGSIKFKTTVSEGAKTLRTEVGTITSSNPEYVFFAGPKHVFLVSMQSGFGHLVGGWDHLLFVFLMLTGRFVGRRWAVLCLSFAAAYTLSFAAISLGWVSFPVLSLVSVVWIESIILGSLFIAGLPIAFKVRPPLHLEAIVVFVLGLFHGLGFASAMAAAQDYNHLVGLKIVGFTGGAFIGQLVIGVVLFAIYRIVNLGQPKIQTD